MALYTVSQVKKKIADYCVYQERCHIEVEEKLKKDTFLNEEEKGEIIIWLIQNNFLNEERFAKSYVRGKFYQKKWGRIKISQGLKQKKIPQKLIDLALKEIADEDYKNQLENIAYKKWDILKKNTYLNKKKKLFSYLLQKGYESYFIYELLDTFKNTD